MNVSYRARVCYFVNVIDIITFVHESRSPDRLQHSMPPVGAEAGGGLLYMFECASHGPTLYSPGAMRQPAFLAPWHAGPLTPLLRRNLFDFGGPSPLPPSWSLFAALFVWRVGFVRVWVPMGPGALGSVNKNKSRTRPEANPMTNDEEQQQKNDQDGDGCSGKVCGHLTLSSNIIL